MLRLCLELIGRLLIRNPKPSPASSQPSRPTAYIPAPDVAEIPMSWHYHQFLTENITGREDLAEIAAEHLEQCAALDPSTFAFPD